MNTSKTLNIAISMLKDLMAGDESVTKREEYLHITGENIREATNLIVFNEKLSDNEKAYWMNNIWRINYKIKPPTVEEFLTPKWIGSVGDQIYPHIRRVMSNFLSPASDKRVLALCSAIGYGKAQSLDSKIYTPSGYKKMRDISIGDKILTPNGGNKKVIAIYPQGIIPLYKVTFRDGRETIVSKDHLWKVSRYRNNSERVYKLYTTGEIEDIGILNNRCNPRWHIPLPSPISHIERPHIIHPYILGILIGDGYLNNTSIVYSSDDQEIVDRINNLLPKGYKSIKDKGNNYSYRIISKNYRSILIQELTRLNLWKKLSHGKFIPKEYLYDSVKNKIELLRGLLDSDGTVSKSGKISFHSNNNPLLVEDVAELVRSLGGTAYIKMYYRENKGNEYNVSISFPNMNIIPFHLSRKKNRVIENRDRKRKRKNTQSLAIIDIKRVEDGIAQCITVDSKEGLYLTDSYTITHNSFLSALIGLYINVHLSYMRDPKQFFGLNEASSIVTILLSFTKEKIGQILLQPFANILRASPIFERTNREDRLEIKQKEIEPGHIAYTSAGRMGAFQFPNDLHIALSSDRSNLLGLTIICGIASEISFWIKKGISIEEIWGTFNDLRERVNSRFYARHLSAVILDSSPLDLSISPIDKWLFEGEAQQDPEVMIVNEKHWEVFPERYPIWNKTHETFPVFRGTASKPPKILTDNKELKDYDREDIIQVPIDKKLAFKNSLKKQIADFAAWPAGGLAKVIEDRDIIENMFSPQLNNVYDYVYAPSNKNPEHLIWNQIKNDFFIEVGKDNFEFYRAPSALRTMHIDLAESGDVCGIAMSHYEVDSEGNNVVVVDFAFGISPEKSTINIDAIAEFVIDLKKLGKIRFHKVTADQWQSSSMIQRFKRDDIKSEKLSVDRDMAPYRLTISWMENGRVKCGKNIIVKNNFGSLIEVTSDKGHTKIDHTKGNIVLNDDGDWKTSFMGVHGKDVSDPLTGSVYTLVSEVDEISKYQWVDTDIDDSKYDGQMSEFILDEVSDKFGLISVS